MLIQNVNTGNTVQTVQPNKTSNDDLVKAAPVVAKTPPAEQVRSNVQQPSVSELKQAVDTINKALQQLSHSLEFSIDQETRKPLIKIVDTETGELIRQIPSEETLAISRAIDQLQLQNGTLLKQKA